MYFIVSIVGSPVADIIKQPISENGSLPEGDCKEGNKWNRMHIKSAAREKSVKNMEKCACNTRCDE